jgi:serine/threonine protein kinase
MNKDGQLNTGDIIGGCYRVDETVASGGMGTVYKVFHQTLGRTLALKTLKTSRISRESWTAFVTEAKVLSRLEHPNLVKVYDLGLIDNRLPYFVMDFIDGEPLSNKIKREGALPVALALAIFEQVAEGLAYGEEIKLLHRDIKPGNIMLQKTVDPTQFIVKIVDFGLATEATGAGGEINQKICGSPPYMSPEQSLYQNLDSRSDMYSLGCSLFETLTGAPPFIGENALITLSKHQTEKPPTLKEASLGTEFAPVLERMMAKMLAKDPANRIQTFAELKQIIKKMRQLEQNDQLASEALTVKKESAKPGQAKTTKTTETKKLPLIAILTTLAIVALGCTGAFLFLKNSSKSQSPNNPKTQAPQDVGLIKKLQSNSDDATQITDEQLCGENNARLFSDFYRHYPFSEVKEISGVRQLVLNFPRTKSAGTIALVEPGDLLKEAQPAQGSLVLPQNAHVYFAPNKIFTASQNLFRQLKPDDLDTLDLSKNLNVATATPSMFDQLTGLRALNLNDTAIGDATIADLSKLSGLKSLKIDRTDITGDGLVKLEQINKLNALELGISFQLDRLLNKIQSSTALNSLKIRGTPVAAHELTLIAKIPGLKILSLDDTNTVQRDLLALKSAPALECLTLSNLLYDPSIKSILTELPHLKAVNLSMGSWNAAAREAFIKDLRSISVHNIDTTEQNQR